MTENDTTSRKCPECNSSLDKDGFCVNCYGLFEYQTTEDTLLYQQAINTWGKKPQLIMCMEEMAELTQALSKNIRGRNNYLDIAEEVADVEIMIAQLKLIFDIGSNVEHTKKKKLGRLAERLQNMRGLSE